MLPEGRSPSRETLALFRQRQENVIWREVFDASKRYRHARRYRSTALFLAVDEHRDRRMRQDLRGNTAEDQSADATASV
jgi:hypothetical protein